MPPPIKKRSRDEEEETPRRRSRASDDDEDDDTASRRSRRRSTPDEEEEEEQPVRKKKKEGGWGVLSKNREEIDANKEQNENMPYEFWLTDKESANIQLLNDEPVPIEGHSIRVGAKKKYKFVPCQLNHQKHCVMCREGAKKMWKYAFLLLDYRGTWDKDKERFKYDKGIEKIWLPGTKQTEMLKTRVDKDKQGRELSEMVIEVTRSGSGKTTSYGFENAEDKNGNKMKPIKYKSEYDELSVLIDEHMTMSDAQLEKLGFSLGEQD